MMLLTDRYKDIINCFVAPFPAPVSGAVTIFRRTTCHFFAIGE